MDHPQYVYQMKSLIKLNNFAVEIVTSKYTTPSEIEGESEVKVKMYWKCMEQNFQFKL